MVYLLRYGQYYPVLQVIVLTVRESIGAIVLVGTLLGALGLFYGGILFYMEMNSDTLTSIPEGIWWGMHFFLCVCCFFNLQLLHLIVEYLRFSIT